MLERPIIFTAESVRAILEGRKTMTRRVIKPQPAEEMILRFRFPRCPYGQVGDRLWVKESFWLHKSLLLEQAALMYWKGKKPAMYYDADMTEHERRKSGWLNGWYRKIPLIFMPRWASRITLEVTGVRVERLQEISYHDCCEEGLKLKDAYPTGYGKEVDMKGLFGALWNSLNAKRGYGWETNPWVWVLTFKRI